MRKIIHIDMDAFFASVEQRDNPALRGKPVAVGGSKARGVVAAASYEARQYGVFSAMPSQVALRKCPHLIMVPTRFEVYQQVSRQIREIFLRYTDLVEPLSLDEAYLDVTENKQGLKSAMFIAQRIKYEIYQETRLTASAGVSFNKFLAKVASGKNKPDGLTVVLPDEAEAFVEALPIEKFYGIGDVTATKMKQLGIHSGADLKNRSEMDLRRHFGKSGSYFYQIARAQDERPVEPNRIRKSIGSERTFMQDLETEEEMLPELQRLAEEVAYDLHRLEASGKTVTLKLKYHDFTNNTRSKTFFSSVRAEEVLLDIATELLRTPFFPTKPVRLLGITVSNLNYGKHQGGQLSFPF
ncbi:DNA polymerase IV [Rufibacter latericius]|uniref:DNA polymerase IV n=1 Tax=Rufibacter latericius TaxID=2487040 RepID=A0A3M9MJJ4_9BACT|nr:DNA polymerase IV [Rufibacter latericius]RNI25732.1 DNA polymerase IV [Rufibacter latericius]